MPTPVYTGKNVSVLIERETAWGTPITITTSSKDLGLIQDISCTEDHATTPQFTCGQRNASDIVAGMFTSKISLSSNWQNGRLLGYALGAPTYNTAPEDSDHSATSTPDIKHTYRSFTSGIDKALQSFTLQHGFNSSADASATYTGCKVDTMTISMGLDGVLKYTADIIARNPTTAATAVAQSVDSIAVLTPYMASITTGAGTSVGQPQSFDVTIKNNIENYPILGDRLPTDSQENEREFEWKFTVLFKDKTQMDAFLGTWTTPLVATPTITNLVFDVNNAVALASGRRQVYIKFATAYPKDHKTISKIKGAIVEEFTGTATGYTAGDIYSYDDITGANW